MSSIGYQLIKTNSNSTAVTYTNNAIISFDPTVINPNQDSNISYSAGVFTFTNAGNYYVNWFVNLQSSLSLEAEFSVQLLDATNTVTNTYPASSVFKTGQVSGSALVSVVDGGKVQLINSSGDIVTLAVGTGMVTAGITIESMPTFSGVQAYASGNNTDPATPTVVADDGVIALNYPLVNQSNGSVTIDTTTNFGRITFLQPGKYDIDWWLALDGAVSTNEVALSLIDNASATLQSSYHYVTTATQIFGFAIISVTQAQATAGYYVELINTSGSQINLSDITRNASIRVTGFEA